MLYAAIFILIALALLDNSTRMAKKEMITYKFRFRLFALRDKLRNSLISDEIQRSNWFGYMDTTITKTITLLPNMNIWEIFLIGYLHRNNQQILSAQKRLDNALNQEENTVLASINDELTTCVFEYLKARHKALYKVSESLWFLIKFYSYTQDSRTQYNLAKIVTTSPETSTLSQFAV